MATAIAPATKPDTPRENADTKLALLLGFALSRTPVWPLAVAVHCWVPQANPLGQQFPPASAGQLYQALGQEPEPEPVVVVVGATMTTPFELRTVPVGRTHEEPVVWQSRPTRQQPEG